MSELETEQDEETKAMLDVTGSSDEGMVTLVEEECWGSALRADSDAGGHFEKGHHDPDRNPVTMV